MKYLYQLHFKLFASLRLTLVILIGLLAALFVGMFWDQTKSLEEHFSQIPNLFAQKIFLFFELGDVFHSWWFGILVLLLALNLIACSIARLPKIWTDARNPKKILDANIWRKANQKRMLETNSLPKYFFDSKEQRISPNGTDYIFHTKHPYARCGVYVIHTALLFLMFGSIFATNMGLDGQMLIPEGRSSRKVHAKGPGNSNYTANLGFLVKCDDFRLKTYTDGSPMAYESDLSIYEPDNLDKPVISKTIRVNDPLEYKGYTFYQASYQALDTTHEKLVNLRIGPHGGTLQAFQTKPLETLPIGPNLKVTEIYEDYAGLGSAIQIEQDHPKFGRTQFVVFRKHPDFDAQVRRGELDIVFAGFDEPYATGISVGKVPGLWAVFLGFILMFVGLYVAFGMNLRRYYAKVTPLTGGRYKIELAGICNRYPQAFEKEFTQYLELIA